MKKFLSRSSETAPRINGVVATYDRLLEIACPDTQNDKRMDIRDKHLGFVFSKWELGFGGPGVPVGECVTDFVCVTNVSDHPQYFKVFLPTNVANKCELTVSPQIMQLLSGEALTLRLTAKFKMMTTLRTDVTFMVPGVGYASLAIRASTCLNDVIDYSELLFQGKAHDLANAKVFKATLRAQEVAVKFFNETAGEMRRDVEKEISIFRSSHSPYIACFFGTVSQDDRFGVVYETSVLGTLSAVMSSHKFVTGVQHHLALDIARAMTYLHNQDIIHCCLASNTIMVQSLEPSSPVLAKICDFGRSRRVGDKRQKAHGSGFSKPIYVAPELMANEAPSKASDVFSFAVVLWEIMFQTDPFEGLDSTQTMDLVVKGGRPSVSPTCPEKIASIIASCWNQDSTQRPAFREVEEKLVACAADFGVDPAFAQSLPPLTFSPVSSTASPSSAVLTVSGSFPILSNLSSSSDEMPSYGTPPRDSWRDKLRTSKDRTLSLRGETFYSSQHK